MKHNVIFICISISAVMLMNGCGILPEPMSLIQPPKMVTAAITDQAVTTNYKKIVSEFLPQGSELVIPAQPFGASAIQLYDVDFDGQNEILVTYKVNGIPGEARAFLLKEQSGKWKKIWEQKGLGYEISFAGIADISADDKPEVLIGWTVGASAGNALDIYRWNDGTLMKIAGTSYHKLELFMKKEDNQDRKTRLAIWQKDTGDAYAVDVLKVQRDELISDSSTYPLYFPSVIDFYKDKLKEMPDAAFYWYYLADAQFKSLQYEEAITSIEKGLELNNGYPANSVFELLKQQIIEAIKKDDNYFAGQLYTNPYFGFEMKVPKEWEGKIGIEEQDETFEDQPAIVVFHKPNKKEKGMLFSIHVYPEEYWTKDMEENSPLSLLAVNNGLAFLLQKSMEHPYAGRDGSMEYKEYEEMVPLIQQVINSFSFPNDLIIKNDDVRIIDSVIEARSRFQYVLNGGEQAGEMKTFMKNGVEYRYLSKDIDTKDKLLAFLEKSFTSKVTKDFYEKSGYIIYNGKIAQPNADGGSILAWKNAKIKLVHQTETIKEFECIVPLGDLPQRESITITYKKTNDGWKIDRSPFGI